MCQLSLFCFCSLEWLGAAKSISKRCLSHFLEQGVPLVDFSGLSGEPNSSSFLLSVGSVLVEFNLDEEFLVASFLWLLNNLNAFVFNRCDFKLVF